MIRWIVGKSHGLAMTFAKVFRCGCFTVTMMCVKLELER